jgi:hypothetical protein
MTDEDSAKPETAIEREAKHLKNLGEVLEKLKVRRREIKAQLAKELKETEESEFAAELHETTEAIGALEDERRDVIRALSLRPKKDPGAELKAEVVAAVLAKLKRK